MGDAAARLDRIAAMFGSAAPKLLVDRKKKKA
jgi:hypothetical protein